MVRKLYCMVFTALWTTLLTPVACLAMLLAWDRGASIWVARKWWSPMLLKAGGARLIVEGREHVDPSRPAIYISNHQSTLDIPVLFMAIPVNLRFVAKQELAYVPVLGWYLRLARFVFVDRGNRQRAIRSLERAAHQIRQGVSIIAYPEGTRSHDGRILPFKKGPFALALKARVPIVPVAIEGSWKVMPKNSWDVAMDGVVRVKIGAPMDLGPYREDQRELLARAVRERIIDLNLQLGGKGGDRQQAIAAPGFDVRDSAA